MKATIGLEIHAELKTKRKMFCLCKNDPDNAEPNTLICPVCMAHPGALPVPNKEAVKHMVKIGLALGGEISDQFSEFDRKSYFYPDMPKAYQISQYKYPIVSGGELAGVKITRVHLEEDTARSIHDKNEDYTYIDFNRSGVPLMELVTEPVIKDADEARRFAKELQLTLRRLGVSDANMEKGQMRVEANVSILNEDGTLGTKVEIKNLNSFKSVYMAIEYELERQERVLASGNRVIQETRGWDESSLKTFSQRVKEEAADYRYFPDPDLPKLQLKSLFKQDDIARHMPELPGNTRTRLSELGLQRDIVEFFVNNDDYLSLFDELTRVLGVNSAKLVANYISTDLSAYNTDIKNSEFRNSFTDIMDLLLKSEISSRTAKDLIQLITKDKVNIPEYIEKNNLRIIHDDSKYEEVLLKALKDNPSVLNDYKNGKKKALGAVIGYSMKELRLAGVEADPKRLTELLEKILNDS